MEIKTIRNRLDNADNFDREVNKALADGFVLTGRYILEGKASSDRVFYTMLVAELIRDETPQAFDIPVKYFDPAAAIMKADKGDWYDLRAAETVEMKQGDYYLIRLGVGMILPDGYEAHVVPRSSTYKRYGIIQANSFGVIDNSYSGDSDEWHFPAVALRDTVITKGDRICQFRIVRNQPALEFTKVNTLNSESRGGFGSTGTR